MIHADDQLRGQFIWHLEQLLEAEGGKFRGRIIPFLRNVWPKQRALRTPPISAKLTNFALASGDLMAEVVELILPRLVPVRVPTLRMALAKDGTDYYPARQHPRTTLDLLWAVLGTTLAFPVRLDSMAELNSAMVWSAVLSFTATPKFR